MLITLEGIDGCGKSSLHEALAVSLSDLFPVMTREPGATWIGDQVRRAIAEQADPIAEALLFVADHAAHLREVVRPALSEGRLVISDRYIDSRFAYQEVSLSGCLSDPAGWLYSVHNGWTVIPDLTFLLVLSVDTALGRTKNRISAEHFEKADVLARVQENYLSRARAEPWRFVIVDGALAPEVILNFVTAEIRKRVLGKKLP
ncbi:dTMP kinase [Methanospirillum lacunae]|uniref:Probable thymidylate kinase n=1 Tax=Methanospirillum lacunae TaxID=668570 RepID=A0A2V2MW00_9EURY|nr:dTMP kinase [Methanospirillum lacunae]PWR72334.1 dTMP kinase [Methanospirillum lacunae]